MPKSKTSRFVFFLFWLFKKIRIFLLFIASPVNKIIILFKSAQKVRKKYYDYLHQLNQKIILNSNSEISEAEKVQLESLETLKNANLTKALSIVIYTFSIVFVGLTIFLWLTLLKGAEVKINLETTGIRFKSVNAPDIDAVFYSRGHLRVPNIRSEGNVFEGIVYPWPNGIVSVKINPLPSNSNYAIFYEDSNQLTVQLGNPNPADSFNGSFKDYQFIKSKDDLMIAAYDKIGHAYPFTHRSLPLEIYNVTPVNWSSNEFYINSIGLQQPYFSHFRSSILKGKVIFSDSKKSAIEITALDSLSIKLQGLAIVKLTGKDGKLIVELKGRVKALDLFSGYNLEQNQSLLPSMADRFLFIIPDYVFQALITLFFAVLSFSVFRQRKAI